MVWSVENFLIYLLLAALGLFGTVFFIFQHGAPLILTFVYNYIILFLQMQSVYHKIKRKTGNRSDTESKFGLHTEV